MSTPENVKCPTCGGSGVTSDGCDEYEAVTCPDCNGTGRTPENVECQTCGGTHLKHTDVPCHGGCVAYSHVVPCPDCTPENVEEPT